MAVACVSIVSAGVVVPMAPTPWTPSVPTASAVEGPPDSFQVVNKTVTPSSGAPNQLFTYSISYSCPGVVAGGTCAGATVTDRIPQFVDIDGATRQLTFVSAAGSGHFSAGVVSGASPNQVITWTASAGLVAGTSGILTMSARVPRGVVPVTAQTVTNMATGTLVGVVDDSPLASATVAATTANWTFAKTGPSTLLINSNGTYTLTVCPQTATGALPSTVSIVDTLPPGTSFISATAGGTFTDNADPTADTITWNITAANRPTPNSSSGCIAVSATVRFVPPASGGDASNLVGAVKTNNASATADTTKNATPLNTTLTGPVTRVTRTKTVSVGGTYVTDGDRVTYALGLQNNSDTGAGNLDTAVLTDGPLPTQFTLDTITTGTWPWGSTASVEISADGVAWTPVASGLTGASSSTVNTGLGAARWVRWNFTGPIAVSQATAGITISGLVTGAVVPSTNLSNCAASTATQGAAPFSSGSVCRTVILEVPQPHPSIAKLINGGSSATVNPGSSATYTIAVANNSDATLPLVDPTVIDCLPAGLAVSSVAAAAGWTRDLAYANGACSGAGGTPLRFTYSGSIAANASAPTISYIVQANGFEDVDGAIAAPGAYPNTATVRTSADTAFGHCVQTNCLSTATLNVPVVAQLTSSKQAQGALDAGWTTAGSTMPGAGVTWRLALQNTGNVDVLNPVFIDIFPHVGDFGVLVYNVPRNSEFGTYLVSPISTTPGWTAEYSTSANPCRPEVGGPVTGCDAPNWTLTPDVTRMPVYQSVKLSYTGLVARGTSATFAWQSRVPVLDASYDNADTTASPYDDIIACGGSPVTCPKAVNSFAYGTYVDPTDLNGASDPGLLRSEPPVVTVAVTSLPRPNIIGDRVFDDVNHDGLQGPTEPGIPNVRVEFFVDVAGSWVQYSPYGYTYTDADGRYLFPDVPDGEYKLRFYLPDSSAYVTLQDVTGPAGDDPASINSGDDSDVPTTPSGSDGFGNYYETPRVLLGNTPDDEIDNTWDAGLWIPRPAVSLIKRVNGADTNTAPGLELFPGDPVTFTYTITNSGNTYLSDVVLTDDVTVGAAPDPVPVCNWGASSDPLTPAGYLSRGETVSCSASDTAINGSYANTATVIGTARTDPSDPSNPATYGTIDRLTVGQRAVSDTDTGHYSGLTYGLGDLVFVDVDGSGSYNPPFDVPVMNGVPVELYDTNDQLVATTSTLAGRYLFTGLRPGEYYVRIPASQFQSGGPLFGLGAAPLAQLDPNTNANEGVDHHAIATGGAVESSGLVTLSSSASGGAFVGDEPTGDDPASIATAQNDSRTNQTIDLALTGPHPLIVQVDAACVADHASLSYRLDYRYFTPTMVGTIQIFPYLPGPDTLWGTADDVPSNVAAQTIANVPLNETVTQLWPGTVLSPRDWPGWQLVNGVWVVDHDGLTPKVLVRATVDVSNTAVATYPLVVGDCDPSPPVASVGDRVWWDADGDGVQDVGEAGIPNASVTLTWAGLDGSFGTGDDVVHPAVVTDASGGWLTTSLPSGNYRASVVVADAVELVPSYDLDGIGSSGASFTLADDEDRRDLDFGYVARFTLGDLVFNDVDGDGRYSNLVDTVVVGLTVQLTDVGGTVLDTDITDAFGRYSFVGLLPGDYRVVVPVSEFTTGGAADGWRVGLSPVTDPDNDVDEAVDHNALAVSGGVRTEPLTLSATLAANGQFSGDEPGGMTNGTVDLALRAPSAISIAKQVSTGAGWFETVHVGFLGGVSWRVVVTNTGGQALHSISVTDAAVAGCAGTYVATAGVLLPGQSFTFTCTSSDLAEGFVNTAGVSGLDPANESVVGSDTASVTVDPPAPGIVLVKYVTDELVDPIHGTLHDANTSPGFFASPGTPVKWVYVLANSGNTPLDITSFVDTNTSPLVVDDFPVLPSMLVQGDTDGDGLLDVDEVWWFATSATTIVSAGQTNTSASVVGTATNAIGTHLVGVTPVTSSNPAHHYGTSTGIAVDKRTNGADAAVVPGPFVRVGDSVTWTYEVSNTSNLALVEVTLVDSPAATITCPGGHPISTLAVGASITCTASVPASSTLGQFRNQVTVTGTPVDGTGTPVTGPGIVPPTATDVSHFFGWNAAIQVVKAIDAVDPLAPTVAEDAQSTPGPIRPAASTVAWTYRVTNTGFAPLIGVLVTDDDPGAVIECPAAHDPVGANDTIALLLPGQTVVCTASVVTGLGLSSTIAVATGQPAYPAGLDATGVAPGSIVWSSDPAVYSAITVGATAVARVTDDDLAHHFGWSAEVSVQKLVNGADTVMPGLYVPEGAPVTWTYVVTNTGFSPLTDVSVLDDIEGVAECGAADGDVDGDIDLLLPGAANAVTCGLSGVAVAALPDPTYSNTVTTSGQPSYPLGDPGFDPTIVDPSDPVWPSDPVVYVPLPAPGSELGGTPADPVTASDTAFYYSSAPSVALVKSTNGADANAVPGPHVVVGDAITWEYEVTNTGNTPLADLQIADDRVPASAIDCGGGTNVVPSLDVGASVVCTARSIAVAGQYANVGSVTATPVDDTGDAIADPATGESVDALTATDPSHYFGASPSFTLVKQVCITVDGDACDPLDDADWADDSMVQLDGVAVWRVVVTNTGNVSLLNTTVTDAVAPGCDRVIDALAPSEVRRWTCRSTGINVPVVNTALAQTLPVDANGAQLRRVDGTAVVLFASDSARVTPPTNLRLSKSVGQGSARPGAEITWTLVVTNTGPGVANGTSVIDTLPAGLQPIGLGQEMVYTASSQQLSWSIGTLQTGESVTMHYTTRVTGSSSGQLTNLAEVDSLSTLPEEVLSDNTDQATVSVASAGGSLPTTGMGVVLLLLLGLVMWSIGLGMHLMVRRR